jgi:toxin ParE1/3/4
VSAFLLSPAARADLGEIWDYTAGRWGTEQAERYVRDITEACQALADERREGRSIDDVRPGYFKLAVGSHFLFYRFTDARVVDVVRILHQRMDIAARLNSST